MDTYAFAASLPDAMSKATAGAALEVTNTVRDAIREDSGGDNVLSGMGARVGARYDVIGRQNPVALIRATGPLQILESDTKPHGILPKGIGSGHGRTKAGRRASKQALYDALFGGTYSGISPMNTPYGYKYRVNHPGTKGKRTWSRAIEQATPRVPAEYQRALQKALRRFFG